MLGRAHQIAPLLASIDASTPAARVVFCCTPDDDQVISAIEDAGRDHITVDYQPVGDYARKINAGYRHTTEDLLFLGAGDLQFHPGWFEAATAQLSSRIGVVGTNDLGSRRVIAGEHSTHSLVTRVYADTFGTIDEPGAILHEGYVHEFCDDELVGTAKHRDAWAMATDAHVEHMHPNWGKAPTDAMYQQQGARMRAGRATFNTRRALWT
jgi:hypothetical protein